MNPIAKMSQKEKSMNAISITVSSYNFEIGEARKPMRVGEIYGAAISAYKAYQKKEPIKIDTEAVIGKIVPALVEDELVTLSERIRK